MIGEIVGFFPNTIHAWKQTAKKQKATPLASYSKIACLALEKLDKLVYCIAVATPIMSTVVFLPRAMWRHIQYKRSPNPTENDKRLYERDYFLSIPVVTNFLFVALQCIEIGFRLFPPDFGPA